MQPPACPAWSFALLVVGVAGVVGWDEGALAGAGDERPAVDGLAQVVGGAERVEGGEAVVVGVGPGVAVVDLGDGEVAAGDGAAGVGPQQCDLLGDGGASAEVADVGDVDPAGDDELDDGVAQQLAGGADRDRADAGDLAGLVAVEPAAQERGEVDAEQGEVGEWAPGPGDVRTVGGAGVGAERFVERVGGAGFAAAFVAGGPAVEGPSPVGSAAEP